VYMLLCTHSLLLQLQERFDDVQTQLKRERDSWKLQETLYNERLKVLQDMQEVRVYIGTQQPTLFLSPLGVQQS